MDTDMAHPVDKPLRRPLRVFAFDPMRGGTQLDVLHAGGRERDARPGPMGARVEVIDYDATRGSLLRAGRPRRPAVLMQDGLDADARPTRASTSRWSTRSTLKVLENFDRALGPADHASAGGPLRLLPHAFHGANAFFDPDAQRASASATSAPTPTTPGENLPGQTVFTCLSPRHHRPRGDARDRHRLRELLPRPHQRRRPRLPRGVRRHRRDLPALQLPGRALASAIAATARRHRLADAAGRSSPRSSATRPARTTRCAARSTIPDPTRSARRPSRTTAARSSSPRSSTLLHDLPGPRIRDLIRIATEGRGVLPEGDLHPDLVDRLRARPRGRRRTC